VVVLTEKDCHALFVFTFEEAHAIFGVYSVFNFSDVDSYSQIAAMSY